MSFTIATPRFLRVLARNHNRPWFESRHEEYETAVKAPILELI